MRHRRLIVALALFAVACGGAGGASETVSPEACERARTTARDAWRGVAEAASEAAAPADDEPELAAEAALERLEAHRDSLRDDPREVDGELAFSLSSAVMDGIDEVSGEIPDDLRDDADDAAEAILTDRGRDGSLRATEGAIAVLERVIRSARPRSAAALERRRALNELARRATRTVRGYETSVELGDRHADRARVAPLPDDVPRALRTRRTEAAERSRDARRACGVQRTLSVPSAALQELREGSGSAGRAANRAAYGKMPRSL
ncbi:MAG TPA: hypothetical protein RMH99_29935 [Sandaracinaceae bacterium LLY-WYZ-13_1]|nr:hypothetical protein [Sandaracinaceae bacterium LLY-WYZ-13_1]